MDVAKKQAVLRLYLTVDDGVVDAAVDAYYWDDKESTVDEVVSNIVVGLLASNFEFDHIPIEIDDADFTWTWCGPPSDGE